MAEPFSIATGAIQVAGAGLQLAKTLYEFIECVKTADRHISAIAAEVKLTSSVLQHLGDLLKDHDGEKLCSTAIISDAGSAFKGCEAAFHEIDDAFSPLYKLKVDGSRSLSTTRRWAWPFKKGRLETLHANLERLKTTLLLMLSVVSYAREKSSKPTGSAVDSTVEKLQMLNLMKAQDDATERHKKLIVENLPRLDTFLPEATSTVHTACPAGHSAVIPQSEPAAHSQSTPLPKPISSEPYSSYEDVLRALATCACVASQLAASVNKASMDWTVSQEMDARPIQDHMETLAPLTQRLIAHDNWIRASNLQLTSRTQSLQPNLLSPAPRNFRPITEPLEPHSLSFHSSAYHSATPLSPNSPSLLPRPGYYPHGARLSPLDAYGTEQLFRKRSHEQMFSDNGQFSPTDVVAYSRSGPVSSQGADFSPQIRSTTIKRGDPPVDHKGKLICEYDSSCSGLTFDRRCEWSKHMDKHDRPYRCQLDECAKLQGFTYSGGLLRHERDVHKKHGGPRAKLLCPHLECKRHTGKGFTRKENLDEHVRRVHENKDQHLSQSQDLLPLTPSAGVLFGSAQDQQPPEMEIMPMKNAPGASNITIGSEANNHALQDWQMQLTLLERQNKKRLLLARQELDRTAPKEPCSRCRIGGFECDRRPPVCSTCASVGVAKGSCSWTDGSDDSTRPSHVPPMPELDDYADVDVDLDHGFGARAEVLKDFDFDSFLDDDEPLEKYHSAPDFALPESPTAEPGLFIQDVRPPASVGRGRRDGRGGYGGMTKKLPRRSSRNRTSASSIFSPQEEEARPAASLKRSQTSSVADSDEVRSPKKRRTNRPYSSAALKYREDGWTLTDALKDMRARKAAEDRGDEGWGHSAPVPSIEGRAPETESAKKDMWTLDSVDELVRRWTTVAV